MGDGTDLYKSVAISQRQAIDRLALGEGLAAKLALHGVTDSTPEKNRNTYTLRHLRS
jgi:hypothetical protein